MGAGYTILPPVYDRWQKTYGKDFSELILPRLLDTMRTHRISGATMADLACGTGTLAILMARRGWRVTGVDASAGMIERAEAKAAPSRLPVSFLRQDMRSFRLPREVHMVTSFFDSLNHILSPSGLAGVFRRVHAALRPGGWFVFDMNNDLCFSLLWTKSELVAHDDFLLELENSYDRGAGLAECRVTLTDRTGEQAPQTEIVRERLYTSPAVREALTAAGFAVRACEDFNFTLNPDVGKIKTWWVAEKEPPASPPRR
jgi:SAM-dependent methyltransferase